jgi:hypothetical protein
MVQLGEISFCDKKAYNIKCDQTKKQILEKLEKLYEIRIISKKFEKFHNGLLHMLRENPHMLCVRSNGNPYYLFLTRINFVNYCIYIDKKIQQGYYYPRMIITTYNFDDALFEDTLIDGEMIKKDTKWSFLIGDIIVHRGHHLKTTNLIKRLNLVYETLDKCFIPDFMDVSTIQVKKYFTYDQIDEFELFQSKVGYSCRGIYFKPLFLKFKDVLLNYDDSIVKKVERFKFKQDFLLIEEQQHHFKEEVSQPQPQPNIGQKVTTSPPGTTTTFKVKKSELPDVFHIVGSPSHTDTICINTLSESRYMRKMFENKNPNDQLLIEFKWNDRFRKWSPLVSS